MFQTHAQPQAWSRFAGAGNPPVRKMGKRFADRGVASLLRPQSKATENHDTSEGSIDRMDYACYFSATTTEGVINILHTDRIRLVTEASRQPPPRSGLQACATEALQVQAQGIDPEDLPPRKDKSLFSTQVLSMATSGPSAKYYPRYGCQVSVLQPNDKFRMQACLNRTQDEDLSFEPVEVLLQPFSWCGWLADFSKS